jgi:hypothetical protein
MNEMIARSIGVIVCFPNMERCAKLTRLVSNIQVFAVAEYFGISLDI